MLKIIEGIMLIGMIFMPFVLRLIVLLMRIFSPIMFMFGMSVIVWLRLRLILIILTVVWLRLMPNVLFVLYRDIIAMRLLIIPRILS